jgi:hypothetical protein
MTSNAFEIIGVHIAACGGVVFFDLEDGILWAIDNTVVAFEAHAATHATFGFIDNVFFGKRVHALFKVAQDFFRAGYIFSTNVT